jgi:hypothetical protein
MHDMTYLEIARELGFGQDFESFLAWADMRDAQPSDEVDEETAAMLREAMAQHEEVDAGRAADQAEQEFFERAEADVRNIDPDELDVIDFSYEIDKRNGPQ